MALFCDLPLMFRNLSLYKNIWNHLLFDYHEIIVIWLPSIIMKLTTSEIFWEFCDSFLLLNNTNCRDYL